MSKSNIPAHSTTATPSLMPTLVVKPPPRDSVSGAKISMMDTHPLCAPVCVCNTFKQCWIHPEHVSTVATSCSRTSTAGCHTRQHSVSRSSSRTPRWSTMTRPCQVRTGVTLPCPKDLMTACQLVILAHCWRMTSSLVIQTSPRHPSPRGGG